MKKIFLLAGIVLYLSSCSPASKTSYWNAAGIYGNAADTLITQSLFTDKNSTITEENIQKVLDGNIQLPQNLRVAVIRLDNDGRRYWNDEDYQKMNQAYMDLLTEQLKKSGRVVKVSSIPDLLISRPLNFTSVREAAVRMQADIAVVYSITGDTYSRYKLFSKSEYKAFANTQLIILDIRTGLVPFSTVITRDMTGQKKEDELDIAETRRRIQHEAALLTLADIGGKLDEFFEKK